MSRTIKIIVSAAVLAVATIAARVAIAAYLIIDHFSGLQIAQQSYQAISIARDDSAMALFNAALKKPLGDYHRSYVLINRATAYNRKRRFDESIRDNTDALRLNPKLTFAYELRAWAHHEKGEIDLELADLNEALRRSSSSEYAYFSRGTIFYD